MRFLDEVMNRPGAERHPFGLEIARASMARGRT
jgi:hypothetical protein